MKIASRRPSDDDIRLDYHQKLIAQVDGDCVLALIEQQCTAIHDLLNQVSTEQVDAIHKPYGWSIRQVIEHCADAERVFGDRMMRIAAGDKTNLPSWDENAYAESRFGLGNFANLIDELHALRRANELLLLRLTPTAWDQVGTVDGHAIGVRVLAWVTVAHLHHHFKIVAQRCGIAPPMLCS